MDTGIGETLREARNRRGLDLAEVESAIKIRVRFLRALENEEWDALPGEAYARGFIRTYASYLGLDGDRLADDYRQATSQSGGQRVPRRVEPVPSRTDARRPRIPGRVLAVVLSLALLGLAVAIGLAGGGGDGGDGNGDSAASGPMTTGAENRRAGEQRRGAAAAKPGVAVRLAATGEVWVCLLDAAEEPLVAGEILTAGGEAGPFRSDRFEVALGNGSVDMFVDGDPADVPPSSSPVGYAIDAEGELSTLDEGERPSCE